MDLATDGTSATGHPIINYEATYPDAEPWISEGKAGLPVLNMVCNDDAVAMGACTAGEIVHSDINAVVAYGPRLTLAAPSSGPYAGKIGHFPPETYPLRSVISRPKPIRSRTPASGTQRYRTAWSRSASSP
jgi:hypothetical protein